MYKEAMVMDMGSSMSEFVWMVLAANAVSAGEVTVKVKQPHKLMYVSS
jgi:hypothetical protein